MDSEQLQRQLNASILRTEFLEWVSKEWPELPHDSALCNKLQLAYIEGQRSVIRKEIRELRGANG